MKKKIGALLDEDLVHRAKKIASAQKQPLNRLLEDALRRYLLDLETKDRPKVKDISEATKGIMSIPGPTLKAILEEKGLYEA